MRSVIRTDGITIILMFLGAVTVSIIGAWSLSLVYHAIAVPVVADPQVFIPSYRNQIRPEPDERFVFTVLVAVVSMLCLFAAFISERHRRIAARTNSASQGLIATAGALIFVIPMMGFEFSMWLIDKQAVAHYYSWLLLGLVLLSVIWYRYAGPRPSSLPTSRGVALLTGTAFIIAMLLQIAAWRVVSSRSIYNANTWNVHFDAVIYTVSQVVMGKTLLADLPSQYGLFPEFMAPLFKVIGLSTLSFTTVCAVMQAASMCCIWWVLNRTVRDAVLKIVASIALVMLTFETVLYFIGIQERYFQYWPVRFFWPAVSVIAFYQYSRSGSLRASALVSLVAVVGAIWNTDSGVMIILAFGAFLAFRLIGSYANDESRSSWRRALWMAMAAHALITIFVAGAFYLYLSSKASGPLRLSWLYEYQITFYKLGFTMLRMPTYPSAWMTVMAVYLMGIISGFVGIASGRRSWSLDNILFLSMLGIGLFVYYQGRSHILNLITVSWPAAIVGAILADRVLRAVRAGAASKQLLVLPATALGVLAFCAAPFVWSIPKLIDDSVTLFQNRHQPVSDIVQDEIRFIQDHSQPGATCAILAQRQGIYYAEAKLLSPLSGPGYIETVLRADRDAMVSQLKSRRPQCIFVGIGASAIDLGSDISEALRGYKVVATNKSNTMRYLTP